MRGHGVEATNDIGGDYDVALVNALSAGVSIDDLAVISSRKIPIVHRKTGYAVSGSEEMRKVVDGVPVGNRMQLDFEQYVDFSIFQSQYSYDVFGASGYEGKRSAIIHNGVDPNLFGLYDHPKWLLGRPRRRRFWDGRENFRLAIVSWSRDNRKGFAFYQRFDEALQSLRRVTADFVGRHPEKLRFRNIRTYPPMTAAKLGAFLRQRHGFLAFSEQETCSNALIEAINCGLQVIYLDSGSNKELASPFGVRFQESCPEAVAELLDGYRARMLGAPENPYDIASVAQRYASILNEVRSGN